MEKLIELLNEFLGEKHKYREYKICLDEERNLILKTHIYYEDCGWEGDWYEEIGFGESIIISKQFGFIERLVENDKINVDEVNCQKIPYYSYLDEEGYVSFKSFGFYEQLLMLLTISDTPIEDLISYLKE